jgi:hypothetical protein
MPAHVRIEALGDFGRDPRLAVLGRKNGVQENLGVCAGHLDLS